MNRHHFQRLLFAAIAAAISIGMAPPAHAISDQQIHYMADVDQHGGLTTSQVFTVKDGNGTTLGDAVRADLKQGRAAANEVTDVADEVTSLNGSMAKAEVAVYWAITDLCPDQMSQRQDHWRDGQ
jgi:hypothetical protein